MVTYIDDVIYGGKKDEVKQLIELIKQHLTTHDIGNLDTYLGLDYKLKKDEEGTYYECTMKKYIAAMIKEFEEHTGKETKDYTTSVAPGLNLLKNDEESLDQKGYRKFVGKALFTVRKVLPDCNNSIREQLMHLENLGKQHWKALGRIMGHLKNHQQPLYLHATKEL